MIRFNKRFYQLMYPYVMREVKMAQQAIASQDQKLAFKHLENAHILGQQSTRLHVKVHVLMLRWAMREKSVKEIKGQIFRIIGAATKTVFGWVPKGNSGGANVSPFKPMPVDRRLNDIIQRVNARC